MNYLKFFVQATHCAQVWQTLSRNKYGGLNKINHKKVAIIRMGIARSRLRFGGDPKETKVTKTHNHYIQYIHAVFNRPHTTNEIVSNVALQYMAQVFILDNKLMNIDPERFEKYLTDKVTEGRKSATTNQQTAIALARKWDIAIQTAKKNWNLLPAILQKKPEILKDCHDISPGSPERFLAKLQECFNKDVVTAALDSEFGIPGAVPYLTQMWWYQNAEQLPEKPFITMMLLKLRESQPVAVITANRLSIIQLAADWDVSMRAIAANSGKLKPELAAAWDAAQSATTAAALRDANRGNRALKLFASTAFGNGAEVVPYLDSSSDRGPFGSVCADMRSVAQSARHWRPLNPEFMFTVGGSANGGVLGKVTSICAFSDSETGEPSVLVGSTDGRSGRIIRITGNGTVVGRSPDSKFLMQGIGVLQDGRCIVSDIGVKDPLTGQTQLTTGMASSWNQPFTLHADAERLGTPRIHVDIVILNNPDGDAPICAFKSPWTGIIKCYQVSADRPLSLTPLAYEFPPFRSDRSRDIGGMCRIPASCQCMCGNAACMQDRLAIVERRIDDIRNGRVIFGNMLYILSPVGELLHEYRMELGTYGKPIKVAVEDRRNELVILCKIPDIYDPKYTLFAWQIVNADNSKPIYPRKLAIDTKFMEPWGANDASIAIIDSMLFIAGGCQLNGYRY